MKKNKVLMILYSWPPVEDVGVRRALKFATYLPDFGWEVLVLTVKHEGQPDFEEDRARGIKVFRTDYVDVVQRARNIFRLPGIKAGNVSSAKTSDAGPKRKNIVSDILRQLITMPDEEIGWYKYAVKEAKRIIEKEGVDLIFSTSPPETAQLVARKLKKRFNIPWVADFRDLWSEDHYRKRFFLKNVVLKGFEHVVLKDADTLITVSEPWARSLARVLPDGARRVKIIENGFDTEDFKGLESRKNKKLTVTYTGKIHKTCQPVSVFFNVLRDLVQAQRIDPNKIDVRFYIFGYDKPDIKMMAREYGLDSMVHEYGRTGYRGALEAQRGSDVLLFFQWQGRGGEGWYSAKIYDYLGAGRPILAMAKRGGIIADLINKTSSGVTADGADDIKKVFLSLYDEYINNGSIKYSGREEEIIKRTRRVQTGELAYIFNSVIKNDKR